MKTKKNSTDAWALLSVFLLLTGLLLLVMMFTDEGQRALSFLDGTPDSPLADRGAGGAGRVTETLAPGSDVTECGVTSGGAWECVTVAPATPTIIEVTPRPFTPEPMVVMEDVTATYIPAHLQRVRDCARVAAACRVVGLLAAGAPVRVYVQVTFYPGGDIWLCLDPAMDARGMVGSDCQRMVAFLLAGRYYGELEFSQ